MQLVGRHYQSGQAVTVDVAGGRIAAVSPLARAADSLPWIAPGLVDLQVNGYGGVEFSSPALTTTRVADIARKMAEFGVVEFLPTTTTADFATLAHAMRTIATACDESADVSRRVAGIHLEGPYISPLDGPRGAHPLAHCRRPDIDEFSRLQEAACGRIKLVTLSAEFDESPRFIEHLVRGGGVAAIGHTAADSEQIRRAVNAGATLSTHLGNGAHPALPRHPNYIWDQLAEDRLMASLIADGHHLPPAVVKAFVRAKSPERIILVSDLSGMAGMPPGRYATGLSEIEILDDGRIVVAGQRQLLAAATRPIRAGIANVMRHAGVDLATAIDMATTNPLKLLGRPAPRLTAGEIANLVLFELAAAESADACEFSVRATIVGGELAFGNV